MGFGQNGSWTLKPMDFRIEVELMCPFFVGKSSNIKEYGFAFFIAFLHENLHFWAKKCKTHNLKNFKIVKKLIFQKWVLNTFQHRNIVKNDFLMPKDHFSTHIRYFHTLWTSSWKSWFLSEIRFFAIFRKNLIFRKLPFWLQKGIKNFKIFLEPKSMDHKLSNDVFGMPKRFSVRILW